MCSRKKSNDLSTENPLVFLLEPLYIGKRDYAGNGNRDVLKYLSPEEPVIRQI